MPGFDANIRTEIEKAEQDAVIRYEKKQAATSEEENLVKDVSDRDTGYDVESFGGKCIEVKSFKTTGSPKITSHEWETAHRMKDDYWLYIVENALDNPKIGKYFAFWSDFWFTCGPDPARMEPIRFDLIMRHF